MEKDKFKLVRNLTIFFDICDLKILRLTQNSLAEPPSPLIPLVSNCRCQSLVTSSFCSLPLYIATFSLSWFFYYLNFSLLLLLLLLWLDAKKMWWINWKHVFYSIFYSIIVFGLVKIDFWMIFSAFMGVSAMKNVGKSDIVFQLTKK